MPDSTGSPLSNPLCMNSRLGNSETYLADDVPTWIRDTLQVDPDSRRWAIAGLSYGGTCALQLGLRRSTTYPTFVDISGESEPSLGSRDKTIRAAFNGDAAAFNRVNPIDLLARSAPATGVAGVLTVGRDDTEFVPQQRAVLAAARKAGMDIRLIEVPGEHNWQAWAGGLQQALPWLMTRLGITAP